MASQSTMRRRTLILLSVVFVAFGYGAVRGDTGVPLTGVWRYRAAGQSEILTFVRVDGDRIVVKLGEMGAFDGRVAGERFEAQNVSENRLPGSLSLGIRPVGTHIEKVIRGTLDKRHNTITGTLVVRLYRLDNDKWVLAPADQNGTTETKYSMERLGPLPASPAPDSTPGDPAGLTGTWSMRYLYQTQEIPALISVDQERAFVNLGLVNLGTQMLQGKHHNGQFEVGYATQNVLPGDASLGIAPVGTRVETILRGRFDKTSNVIRGTATERYYSLEGGRWVLQQNDAGASDSEFVMERAPLLSSIVSVDPGTGLPSALANSNDPVALRASAH